MSVSQTSADESISGLGLEGAGERTAGRAPWRIAIVAAVLIAAALLIHLTPIRSYLADARHLRVELLGLGLWVYPVAIAGAALLLACGAPRLPIHAAGGMIFGFTLGLVLTFVGAMIGHYAVFLFIRWGGREWVLDRWPSLTRLGNVMRDRGVVAVLLARQLPAHAMIINAALALSHVTQRQFLIGTAVGLLPEAIPATLIGAGLLRASLRSSAAYLTVAAAAFAIIWLTGGTFFRAAMRKQSKESAA